MIDRLRATALCAAIVMAVAGATMVIDIAYAQSTGPAPNPSPSPSPTPPGGKNNSVANQEDQAFANLLDLYDAMLDAQARLKYAGICGSFSDVADAADAFEAAKAAFNAGMDSFIRQFSDQLYSGPVDKMSRAGRDAYYDDWEDVYEDLVRADKKQHPVGDCPRTPAANGPAPKKPHPHHLPPPETPLVPSTRSGRLTLPLLPDCFAHDDDRGEVISGLQRQRQDFVGDPSALDAIDATIVNAGATPTCAVEHHGSVFDHVSIGIGVGIGGGDDHRHDRGHGRDTVQPPGGDGRRD